MMGHIVSLDGLEWYFPAMFCHHLLDEQFRKKFWRVELTGRIGISINASMVTIMAIIAKHTTIGHSREVDIQPCSMGWSDSSAVSSSIALLSSSLLLSMLNVLCEAVGYVAIVVRSLAWLLETLLVMIPAVSCIGIVSD